MSSSASRWERSANGEGKSHTERQRELRKRKRGKPVPPGTKHGTYAYRVYRCRCGFCVFANRRQSQKERNAWRESAQGTWVSGDNGSTTVHWPPRGEGMWACPECGEKFQMRRPLDDRAQAAA